VHGMGRGRADRSLGNGMTKPQKRQRRGETIAMSRGHEITGEGTSWNQVTEYGILRVAS